MLDEGETDVFLLLLEDVKTPAKFRRVADKALRAGKPLIVAKIGQTEPGRRAVASHTAALAGSHAAYRAIFEHSWRDRRPRFRRDDRSRGRLPRAAATKLPAGKRMGICTSSGGAGVWMADACVAAGLDVPELDAQTRAAIDVHLPSYGTSQNPVDATAQACTSSATRASPGWSAPSPLIDGVMVVVTARRSAFLENDLPNWRRWRPNRRSRSSCGATRCPRPQRRDPQRSGLSAVHQCRRLRAHHAGDGGLPGLARAPVAAGADRRRCAAGRRRRAHDVGGGGRRAVRMARAAPAGGLWHRRRAMPAHSRTRPPRRKRRRAPGRAGGAQGAIGRHSAQDRGRRRGAQSFR